MSLLLRRVSHCADFRYSAFKEPCRHFGLRLSRCLPLKTCIGYYSNRRLSSVFFRARKPHCDATFRAFCRGNRKNFFGPCRFFSPDFSPLSSPRRHNRHVAPIGTPPSSCPNRHAAAQKCPPRRAESPLFATSPPRRVTVGKPFRLHLPPNGCTDILL